MDWPENVSAAQPTHAKVYEVGVGVKPGITIYRQFEQWLVSVSLWTRLFLPQNFLQVEISGQVFVVQASSC